MLRINLIPETKRTKVSSAQKEILLFILFLIVLVGGLYFLQDKLEAEITRLKKNIHHKQNIKKSLQQKVKKATEIEKKLQSVEKKIEIIKKIRARQSLPVKIIDQVVAKIPKDSLWYEKFHMDGSQDLTLQGIAMDNQVFASYLQSLRSSNLIRDISLKRTSRHNYEDLKLIEFQCQVKTKAPDQKSD